MMKMKKTALIILNFNNVEDTINCIESVEQFNSAPVKLVVVDNGSSRADAPAILHDYMQRRYGDHYIRLDDESAAAHKGSLPYATLLASATNDGYARGNNKGLQLVSTDNDIADVMILNNDILFVEDIIPTLIKSRDGIADCAIISPLLLKGDRKSIDYNCARRATRVRDLIKTNFLHYLWRLRGREDEDYTGARFLLRNRTAPLPDRLEVDLPSGSCMLIDRNLFESIGRFDPGTFLYFEEDILHKKLSSVGKRNYIVPSLRCVHLGAVSTSRRGTTFTLRANNLSERYYVKHFSGASRAVKWLHLLSSKFFWLSLRLQKGLLTDGLSHQKQH